MVGEAARKTGARSGELLSGKYMLEDLLGIGGMGEVYRATNMSLGREVAIKLLSKDFVENEDDVLRFLREARAAAAVRHPNVVDVLDVARDEDGTPYIVQELLSGQDLEQHLKSSGGRLGVEETLEIMIPVADAISAAHDRQLVHRDLKPANIFLSRGASGLTPKVLDFGAVHYETVGELSKAERRMLIGTPHYMAPEQISSKADVDSRSDVWALGVLVYELLAGETPFEAETAAEVMKFVRTRPAPPLRKVAPKAPPDLERLVASCLEHDKAKRPADARALRAELDKIRTSLKRPSSARHETVGALDAVVAPREAPPPPPKMPPRASGKRPLSREEPEDAPPEHEAAPRGPRHPLELDDAFGEADLDLAAPPRAASVAPPRAQPSQAPQARAAPPAPSGDSFGEADLDLTAPPVPADPSVRPPPRAEPSPRTPDGALTPALATPMTPAIAPRRAPAAAPATKDDAETTPPLSRDAKLRLAGIVLGPAVAAFAVLHFARALAPLGRAMRGESMIASGVLAVVALVSAAVLGARSFSTRERGVGISAVGAILLGVAMIIVTFAASEAAEAGDTPALAGIVPFLAPIAPLGLAWVTLSRSREAWPFPLDRREALVFAALTSLLVLVALELSPLGAFRIR